MTRSWVFLLAGACAHPVAPAMLAPSLDVEGRQCLDEGATPRWAARDHTLGFTDAVREYAVPAHWEVDPIGPHRVRLHQIPDPSQPGWTVELLWVVRCDSYRTRTVTDPLVAEVVTPLLGEGHDVDWGDARLGGGFAFNAVASAEGRDVGVWARWVVLVSNDSSELVLAAACGREADYEPHCGDAVRELEEGVRGMVD